MYPLTCGGWAQTAREAARLLGRAETAAKNAALLAIADAIVAERARLVTENHKDLEAGRQRGLEAALLDRLELTDARIDSHGRRSAPDRGAAGPGGGHQWSGLPAQRYPGGAHARAARRHRHHL